MPMVYTSSPSYSFASSHADTSMDKDLRFLTHCENSELRKLCDILTHDKDGRIRFSESLTVRDVYLENYPENLSALAPAIADELLRFGSNTLVTAARHGVPDSYETVVRRVCRQMDVRVGTYDDAATMEHALLERICTSAIKSMSVGELRNLADKAGIPIKSLKKQVLMAGILAAMQISPVAFRQVAMSVTCEVLSFLLGRGVAVMGVRAFQRSLGIWMGPLQWILLLIWAAWDCASPAYRVCIPAVIQIAIMRLSFSSETEKGRNA